MEEFIKKLSVETHWSYAESRAVIEIINTMVGHIYTAKIIYEKDGLNALTLYAHQVKLGVNY